MYSVVNSSPGPNSLSLFINARRLPVITHGLVAQQHLRVANTAAGGVEGTAAALFSLEGVGNWHKTTGGGRGNQAGGPSTASTAERPKNKDARSLTNGATTADMATAIGTRRVGALDRFGVVRRRAGR